MATVADAGLATAVPVSGSYHTADAAGLLWSPHPAPGTNQATGFVPSAAGFTIRLEVLPAVPPLGASCPV